jgi:hypothetical protein
VPPIVLVLTANTQIRSRAELFEAYASLLNVFTSNIHHDVAAIE